jgi:hypothetical protein
MTNKLQQQMIKSCLDSAKVLYHRDNALGLFLADLVNETLGEIYESEYPHLGWASGELVYHNTSLDAGALTVDAAFVDYFGRARLVDPAGDDVPTADVQIQRDTRVYQTLAHSFFYTTQELRSSQKQRREGFPVDVIDLKADSAKLGHDQELNDLIAFGSEAKGLYGVTNHPGILISQAGTGDWTNPATTSAQINSDIQQMFLRMKLESRGVYKPNTMVVGPAVFERLTNTYLDAGLGNSSNITIAQSIKDRWGVELREEATMELASQSGENAALLYENSPKRLQSFLPLYMAPVEGSPERKGFKSIVLMETRFAGSMVQYPKSVLRLDGI